MDSDQASNTVLAPPPLRRVSIRGTITARVRDILARALVCRDIPASGSKGAGGKMRELGARPLSLSL